MSKGRYGHNTNLMEDAAMKNMFISSKGKGNGVNTTNRCMGCTNDCESCIFKDVAGQFNKAAEEGGQSWVTSRKTSTSSMSWTRRIVFPDLDNLTPEEVDAIKKGFYSLFDAMRKNEEKRKREGPHIVQTLSRHHQSNLSRILWPHGSYHFSFSNRCNGKCDQGTLVAAQSKSG